MAPWQGPRHRSWASNGNIATLGLAVIFLTWLGFEIPGDAPPALGQLLGVTAGIWFGAMAGDKKQRDADTEREVERLKRQIEDGRAGDQ